MGAWVFFRRARITLFCFLVLSCLSWATLFAVFLSYEWSHCSRFQKIIVASSLSLYGFSAIFLYLMVVIQFRLWWEVARLFVLLVVHSGISVLFTIYSPSFPCGDFGTETACKEFLHTIFFGSWVLSGIILFLLIALGVMAFIPRPVESAQGTEEVNRPSTPASFKAGSPTEDLSFYSIDSHTGFVTYNNGGKSPDYTPSPINRAHGETITMGPPRLRLGFESSNLGHSNNTYGGTMPTRNAPTEHTSVISGPRRVDPFRHIPPGNPSPPAASIYSRESTIRPGVGRKNIDIIAENRLNHSSAFPGLKHDALSPSSLHGSPPPVTTPRDLAAEYTPTLYSVLGHHSVPASPGDHSQREQTYPDRARAATPSIYSFQSSAAGVDSMWEEPTPHIPPPPVLKSDIARFRDSSSSLAYLGPESPSSGNNAPSTTSGSNAPLTPMLSEPNRTMQYYGALSTHQSSRRPAKEGFFSRRGSNGQALDQRQWRRLVLNAAAKP